jgi:hypothetical protein
MRRIGCAYQGVATHSASSSSLPSTDPTQTRRLRRGPARHARTKGITYEGMIDAHWTTAVSSGQEPLAVSHSR